MLVIHKSAITPAKLISLYLFLLKTCGKLQNINLITHTVIHIHPTLPVRLLITAKLSTVLLVSYQQVINRFVDNNRRCALKLEMNTQEGMASLPYPRNLPLIRQCDYTQPSIRLRGYGKDAIPSSLTWLSTDVLITTCWFPMLYICY